MVIQRTEDDVARLADQLLEVLEAEYQALKSQDLVAFDNLQPTKQQILTFLSSDEMLRKFGASSDHNDGSTPSVISTNTKDVLRQCQRAHQRNELIINKQLDVIKASLETIQNQEVGSSLELYTKLGKKKTSRKSVLSGDA